MLGAGPAAAQPPVRQVLLLQSFDRGNLNIDHFTSGLRVELNQRAGGPVNVLQVVVGPTGFVGAPEQAVVDFIRSTFADRPKPDLIVTVAGPAAVFAHKYRQQLFPGTPLLFASVDERYLRDTPLGDNDSAVAVANDFPELVDEILQLLPETRQVFMVMGSGSIGRFWRQQLEDPFRRFDGRLNFVWPDEPSLSELLLSVANLPDHSAIVYINFDTDGAGAANTDERIMAELHAAANAPLFAGHSVFLGAGVVGGRLMSIDELSRRTAAAAIDILNGVPPRGGEVLRRASSQPIFDWRELQRWGVPESRLPPGSVVRFREPTLWGEYKGTVLMAAGVLVVQALLIIGLLVERRARQRAEVDSRRNLVLAADVSRRETMSAMTTSIGHELTQPLSSIMHNAQALQMMATANAATPDAIKEVLSDIQTDGLLAARIIERHRTMLRSRQLQAGPIDLQAIIEETLALVAHDIRARQIQTTIDLPSTPCIISGDPVLLQQVLVNLVINAMDAMTETPPAQRHITISSGFTGANVAVSVRDTGPGLRAEIIDKLFTPFVTTKSHGLGIGLTIARRIVDAHGGVIEGRNHPEGGAMFTVTLRRADPAHPSTINLSQPSDHGPRSVSDRNTEIQ